MDTSRLGAGEPALLSVRKEVVELSSNTDSGEEEVAQLSRPLTDEERGKGAEKPQTVAAMTIEDDDDSEVEWEEESIMDDVIEELSDDDLRAGGPGYCTIEEAHYYRRLLRSIGPAKFISETIEADKITAKKLLTAFGIRPPGFLEGLEDENYYSFLGAALSRELSKRLKLPQYNTVDDAADLIKRSKNIIVLTGAGISTSLGIPDFRSKDTGLYTKLAHLGLSDPQEVFDIHTFREDPYIFYSIAKDILPDTNRFSPTHAFIRLLQDKGKLLTNYSQNIDNLESKAGILPEKLVQCHGSFATASCVKCHAQVPGEAIYGDLKAGHIPRCQSCVKSLLSVKAANGKRKRKSGHSKERKKRFDGYDTSSEDEGYDVQEAGVMKPDITFFGEALPDTFHDRLTKHDRDLVDLVIVIGTSLKVAPVSEVVPYLPKDIPQMYISRTPVNHVHFDVDMLGDCDVVVAELCRRAGWELKHEMVVSKDVKIDVRLQEGYPSRHIFKVRDEEVQDVKVREEEVQDAKVQEEQVQTAKVLGEEMQAAKVREEEAQAAKGRGEEVQATKVREEEVQVVTAQEGAPEKKLPENVQEEKVRAE